MWKSTLWVCKDHYNIATEISLGEACEVKDLLCSQVLERKAQHTMWGPIQDEHPVSGLNQAYGELRESEDQGQVPFLRVMVKYASQRLKGSLLLCFSVANSQSSGKKGPALSLWCTWSLVGSWPVCEDVEVSGKQEVLKIYNVVLS